MTLRGQVAFENAHYSRVIVELRGQLDLCPDELALLGIAELQLGEMEAAELHVLRPQLAGAEYGWRGLMLYLSRTGQLQRLRELLKQPYPAALPNFELICKDLTAWTAFWCRDFVTSRQLAQEAALAWFAQGKEMEAAASLGVMAAVWTEQGKSQRPFKALEIALAHLPTVANSEPHLRVALLQVWLNAASGHLAPAQERLSKLAVQVAHTESTDLNYLLQLVQYDLGCWLGKEEAQVETLQRSLAQLHEDDLWYTIYHVRLLERLILQKDYAQAFLSLAILKKSELAAGFIQLKEGLLHLLLGNQECALSLLTEAKVQLTKAGDLLGTAQCNFMLGHASGAGQLKDQGLMQMLGHHKIELLRQMKNNLMAMLEIDSEKASAMTTALMSALELHLKPPALLPVIRIETLGTIRMSFGSEQLSGPIHLICLLLLKGALSRAELEVHLYPDRSPSAAQSAVKQDIHRLRKLIGEDAIVCTGTHLHKTYQLSDQYHWQWDVLEFRKSCLNYDSALILGLYRGNLSLDLNLDWVSELGCELEYLITETARGLEEHFQRQQAPLHAAKIRAEFIKRFPCLLDLFALEKDGQEISGQEKSNVWAEF